MLLRGTSRPGGIPTLGGSGPPPGTGPDRDARTGRAGDPPSQSETAGASTQCLTIRTACAGSRTRSASLPATPSGVRRGWCASARDAAPQSDRRACCSPPENIPFGRPRRIRVGAVLRPDPTEPASLRAAGKPRRELQADCPRSYARWSDLQSHCPSAEASARRGMRSSSAESRP